LAIPGQINLPLACKELKTFNLAEKNFIDPKFTNIFSFLELSMALSIYPNGSIWMTRHCMPSTVLLLHLRSVISRMEELILTDNDNHYSNRHHMYPTLPIA